MHKISLDLHSIILFLVIFALLIIAGYLSNLEQLRKIKKVALDLGLNFKMDYNNHWRLTGNYKNSFVEIFTELIGNTKSRKGFTYHYTIILMKAIQPLPFEMKITKRGMIENIFKKFFTTGEIKTGDAKFDRSFIISGDSPEEIIKLCLNPVVQEAIYELMHAPGFSILSKGIYYDESGINTNINFYKWALPRMSMAVDTIYGKEK